MIEQVSPGVTPFVATFFHAYSYLFSTWYIYSTDTGAFSFKLIFILIQLNDKSCAINLEVANITWQTVG